MIDKFPWDAWEGRLEELVEEGLSISAIAEVLTREARREVTRNAVVSKVRRAGLILKRSFADGGRTTAARERAKRDAAPKVSKPSPITSHLFSGSRFWKPPDSRPAPKMPSANTRLAGSTARALLDLGFGQCRFPVDEKPGVVGRYLFCAAPVAREGCSWCEAHAGVAWAEGRRAA